MYVFAHLGIGYTLVTALPEKQRRDLPPAMIFLGTILSDLSDKLLYYGLAYGSGLHGAELGWIAGTRSFGHTALFLAFLFLIAKWRSSKKWTALAWGVATHLLLDNAGDIFASHHTSSSGLRALLWPLMGWQFPVIPYRNLQEQVGYWAHPVPLAAEVVGVLLLLRAYRLHRIMKR